MGDTFGPFTVKRGSDGSTFPTTIAQINPPGPYTADDATDPSQSPTGKWFYTVSETTGNGVVVPYNTVKIGNSGAFIWASEGLDKTVFYCAKIDGSGNVVCGGGIGGNPCLAKFDASTGATGLFLGMPQSNAAHPRPCYVQAISIDPVGNIFVTGSFSGTLDCGNGKTAVAPVQNIFVAKFNSSLVCQWVNGYGNGIDDINIQVGLGIVVDHAGNIVVTGTCEGDVDFGGGTRRGIGFTDVFVLKLDGAGHHIWSIISGSNVIDTGGGVAVDASNNVFFTGGFGNTMTIETTSITSNSFGALDIFLWKLDPDGHPVWGRNYGGADWHDAGIGITVNGDNNPVVTGWFNSTINFGGGNRTAPQGSSGADGFVAQFHGTDGSWMWDHQFHSSTAKQNQPTISGFDVTCDALNNVAVTGVFGISANFGGDTFTASGYLDCFIAKYDKLGNHIWSAQFGTNNGAEISYGVTGDATGIYVAGYFLGTMMLRGTAILQPTFNGDGFLIKFSP